MNQSFEATVEDSLAHPGAEALNQTLQAKDRRNSGSLNPGVTVQMKARCASVEIATAKRVRPSTAQPRYRQEQEEENRRIDEAFLAYNSKLNQAAYKTQQLKA